MLLIDKTGKKFSSNTSGLSRAELDKIRGKTPDEAKKIHPSLKIKERK